MKVRMVGMEEVKAFIQRLPRGMKIVGMRGAAWYMVGDARHGFKWYPAKTTQKYKRTFTLRRGWYFTESNSDWKTVQVRNEVSYTPYVPRWKEYGWREWLQVAKDNLAGAIQYAQIEVNRFIARKGK